MATTATSRSVTIIGLPQAQAKFSALAALVDSKMTLILGAGALPIMNKAKALAPYRTGDLRRSIHPEVTGPNTVTVGTNLVYAAAQEFGLPGGGWQGSDIPAHPYLRPALDTGVAAATASMQKALRAVLEVAL